MYELDEIDRAIIHILQKDGRTSNVDIARQIGVTEGTVRKRLDRLFEQGIVHVVAFPEPTKIGYPTRVLIGLQVDMGALNRIVEQILHSPQVCSVQIVTGEYDILIEGYFKDNSELLEFLANDLGRMGGIRHTSTIHVLHTVKPAYQWTIPEPSAGEILVVDDDPDFLEYCRMVLEEAGYRVRTAANGSEALSQLRVLQPDLIILDVMMQDVLDGLHAAERMRSANEWRGLPILMVSSILDSPYAGMFPTDTYVPINAFLTKPVDPDRLKMEVRRLMKTGQKT